MITPARRVFTSVIPSGVEEPCVCSLANPHPVILRSRGPSRRRTSTTKDLLHSAAPHTIRGRARLQSCRTSQKKDSGTANPPDQPKIIPPAHFSFDNRSAARSILSQVLSSRAKSRDLACCRKQSCAAGAPQPALSGVEGSRAFRDVGFRRSGIIRIVLAISIHSSSSSDTDVPR